jgi:hypothetical protein
LKDHQIVSVQEVDQAVFLADPARPCACQQVPQRRGFADAGGGIAKGVVDEPLIRLRVARSAASQYV